MLIVNCSEDFGKTLELMNVPNGTAVESLTAGMIGLWVAIHTINPATDQHEVQLSLYIYNSNFSSHRHHHLY